jgi:hypothetical protein
MRPIGDVPLQHAGDSQRDWYRLLRMNALRAELEFCSRKSTNWADVIVAFGRTNFTSSLQETAEVAACAPMGSIIARRLAPPRQWLFSPFSQETGLLRLLASSLTAVSCSTKDNHTDKSATGRRPSACLPSLNRSQRGDQKAAETTLVHTLFLQRMANGSSHRA